MVAAWLPQPRAVFATAAAATASFLHAGTATSGTCIHNEAVTGSLQYYSLVASARCVIADAL